MPLAGLAADLSLALNPRDEEPGSTPMSLARLDMRHNWIPGEHVALMDEAFVWAATTPGARLIVEAPPRHVKSTINSRYGPAWYMGRYPSKRVGLIAYGDEFAATHGAVVRDVIERHGKDLYGITLKQDSKAKNRWNIERHAGGMFTAGIGGTITGLGFDLGIIDDPVKNSEEARSQVSKRMIREWFPTTFYSRLEPDASIIITMTRWTEDDLIGWMLSPVGKEYGPWERLRLPALAEADDPMGRKPGEALWPKRTSVKELEKTRRAVGTPTFSAMWQQRPQPEAGGLFKQANFRSFRVKTERQRVRDEVVSVEYFEMDSPRGLRRIKATDCWRFGIVDLAASLKTSADYTTIGSYIVGPANELLILDMDRDKMEGPDQLPRVKRAYENNHLGDIGIESVGYQLTMVQAARRAGLPVREIRAERDKYSRALVAAARYEAGEVYHLEGAHWVGEMESELVTFPTGAHDDQVDNVAYACIRLAGGEYADVEHGASIYD